MHHSNLHPDECYCFSKTGQSTCELPDARLLTLDLAVIMALSSLLVIITITKPCNDRRHGQFDTLRHQIKERVSLYKPIILISSVLLPRSSVKASADLKNARYKGCIRVTNRHKWSYLLVHTDCLFISMSRHSLFTKVSASIKVS